MKWQQTLSGISSQISLDISLTSLSTRLILSYHTKGLASCGPSTIGSLGIMGYQNRRSSLGCQLFYRPFLFFKCPREQAAVYTPMSSKPSSEQYLRNDCIAVSFGFMVFGAKFFSLNQMIYSFILSLAKQQM